MIAVQLFGLLRGSFAMRKNGRRHVEYEDQYNFVEEFKRRFLEAVKKGKNTMEPMEKI